MQEFEQYMEQANVIVCHGGCGSISHCLRLGKVPVVVPRRKHFGEHVNDHQLQITQVLAHERRVIPVFEIEKLSMAIDEARRQTIKPLSGTTPRIFALVSRAIEELVVHS